jgi:small-conductance mechanosensitive channel
MVPSTTVEPAPVEIPENLTQEQVRDLIAHLSDDQVRQLIIEQLDKVALEQEQASLETAYVGQLREGIHVAWQSLARIFASGDSIHSLPGKIWNGITDNGRTSGTYLLFQLLGLLFAGFAVERLAKGILEKTASKPVEFASLGKRFDLACLGAALGLVELGAFAAGAYLFVAISSQHAPTAQGFWNEVVLCVILIKLVLLAVRQVAAPRRPEARLVMITDGAARQTWGWALILMASLVLPQPLIQIAVEYGASAEEGLFLNVLFRSIFMVVLIVLVFQLRHYGAELIAGDRDDSSPMRQTFARIWWMLAIVYMLLIWLMAIGNRAATGESSLVPGLGSLALFAAIPFLDMGLKHLVNWYFEPKPEDEEASDEDSSASIAESETAIEGQAQLADSIEEGESTPEIEAGYKAVALHKLRVMMVLALLAIFARLWNINVEAFAAELVGNRVASALFDISITILLAWALWGVIRISIERKLEEERGPETEMEEVEAGGLGGTRTETILPLIRIFIKITLIVMTVMVCLSALGVNIGPLIAGAGVVGIAIGFGAQTLVRDIVSGFFYLMDDAFRIGEYVVIDQIRGTVEKISVRSFQLRHHNGPVHTIPYGEIRSLTNWSRDWAIMKCELRVPFETDIEKVRKMIKKIGIEMMEDPQWGPLMLGPVKSQGVNRMDDSALIIRFKFTAVPGQQYLIRREAFMRIQGAFEAEGIHFAPRRVLVEATTPQEAIKGAAAVLDQEVEGESAPKNDQSNQ